MCPAYLVIQRHTFLVVFIGRVRAFDWKDHFEHCNDHQLVEALEYFKLSHTPSNVPLATVGLHAYNDVQLPLPQALPCLLYFQPGVQVVTTKNSFLPRQNIDRVDQQRVTRPLSNPSRRFL